MKIRNSRRGDSTQLVAGNGLIDRRALLGRGILIAGATTTGVTTSFTGAAAEPLPQSARNRRKRARTADDVDARERAFAGTLGATVLFAAETGDH